MATHIIHCLVRLITVTFISTLVHVVTLAKDVIAVVICVIVVVIPIVSVLMMEGLLLMGNKQCRLLLTVSLPAPTVIPVINVISVTVQVIVVPVIIIPVNSVMAVSLM